MGLSARNTIEEGMGRALRTAALVAIVVVVALGYARISQEKGFALPNGTAVPPLALPSLSGGEVDLSSYRGKVVVLNFWATWCVPCYQEHPLLISAAQSLGEEVHFLGVVYQDEDDRVREWLRQEGSAYPSLLDPEGKTAIAYGVYGVPETYFIDPGGTIVAKHVGALDGETLMARLRQARGATP